MFLPQMRLTHEQIVERALAAEAAGFEGMAFMDHLAPPLAFEHGCGRRCVATWVLAKTTTLKVGHLVLCDAFRHPAVLARQATSLDHAPAAVSKSASAGAPCRPNSPPSGSAPPNRGTG